MYVGNARRMVHGLENLLKTMGKKTTQALVRFSKARIVPNADIWGFRAFEDKNAGSLRQVGLRGAKVTF